MNGLNKTIITALLCGLLCACSTTEKFMVSTPSGTKLYSPEGVPVVTRSNRVEISSNVFWSYMLAQPEGCPVKIPFGLNFHDNSHSGTKFACGVGGTVTCVGLTTMGVGLVYLGGVWLGGGDLEDHISNMWIIEGIGAGVTLLGGGIYEPSKSRLDQKSYQYNYSYDKMQSFEMPNLSYTLINPDPGKDEGHVSGNKVARKKATTTQSGSNELTATGSKANKTRSSLSSKIAGLYTGNGQLMLGKDQEEFYSEISIEIKSLDKTHVSVRIIEDGDDFFESPLVYVVGNDKNGGYLLKMEDMPGVTATITKKGSLTFDHSKVIIDDQSYRLIIKASKKE